MTDDRFGWLVCPSSGQALRLEHPATDSSDPVLRTADGTRHYPVISGIPRFVPSDNYANTFGYQWNRYAKLQLDSFNGTSCSRDRFYAITNWNHHKLSGKKVLDVGCGSGRFAEIALDAGADVTAIDLSSAVDACRDNLAASSHIEVVQASVYAMPFPPAWFDYVYCIGVVQHTPDPKRSIFEIAKMVKPGGHIGLWIYERNWKSYIGTVGFKYLLRPLTRRMARQQVVRLSNALERLCWPVNRVARSRGVVGKMVMRMLPVSSSHLHGLALNDENFREWVRLDTFDMYSPAHDHPLTFSQTASWLEEAGFTDICRHPHPGISITARRSD